ADDLARHGRPVELMRRRQPLMGNRIGIGQAHRISSALNFRRPKSGDGAHITGELAGSSVMTTPQAWSAPITVRLPSISNVAPPCASAARQASTVLTAKSSPTAFTLSNGFARRYRRAAVG